MIKYSQEEGKVSRSKARKFLVASLRHWPHVHALDVTPAPSGWGWARTNGHALLVRDGGKDYTHDVIRCADWSQDRNTQEWPRPLPPAYTGIDYTSAAKRPTSHYVEGYKGKTAGHRADQGGLRAHSCGELYPFRIVAHPNDEWSAVAPDGSKIIRAYSQCTAVKAARIARIAWQYGCPLTGLRHVVQAADLDEVHYV